MGNEAVVAGEEIERFVNLVKETVGFDANRGDSVSVINAPFLEVEAPASPTGAAGGEEASSESGRLWPKPLESQQFEYSLRSLESSRSSANISTIRANTLSIAKRYGASRRPSLLHETEGASGFSRGVLGAARSPRRCAVPFLMESHDG